MASVELVDSGEEGFLSKLERARREMRAKFGAVHELLRERESALLAEFQELEDEFRGVGRADEMRQLSLSKEQLQNTLKGNANKEILSRSIAPLDERMKELEIMLEKGKALEGVYFDWDLDESIENRLNSLGRIVPVHNTVKICNKVAPNYKQKGIPVAVFGKCDSKSRSPGSFHKPNCIILDENRGYIYICDGIYNRVQVFNMSYQFLFMFSQEMNGPRGIFLFHEKVCITQLNGNFLNIYSLDGNFIRSVGKKGVKELEFSGPRGIAISTERKIIYICESLNNRIQCLNLDFSFHSFIPNIYFAKDVKSLTNEIVVLCEDNPCLRIYNSSHQLSRQFITKGKSEGSQINNPGYFYIDANLNILLTDLGSHCVLIFSYAGEFIHKFGKKGEEKGDFIRPRGLTMDSEDRIIVTSDNPNHSVQIF